MMKRRARTTSEVRTDFLTRLPAEPALRASRVKQAPKPANMPSIVVVPEAQFTELLTMLERPPEVSAELRREVANRRWK